MTTSRDVHASGVEALRRLGDRPVERLPEEVQGLLEQIRDDLGVPSVNLIFRVLALEPELLAALWTGVAPIVADPAFDAAALRLRALALPGPSSRPEVSAEVRDVLADVVPRTRTVVPRLHLVMAGLWSTAVEWSENDTSWKDTLWSTRVARPERTEAGSWDGDLLHDVTAVYGHPLPATFFRRLVGGRHPVLPVVWPWLRPWVRGPAYEAGRDAVVHRAVAEARELGLDRLATSRPVMPAVLSADELVAVLRVFLHGYAPDVALTASALSNLVR